MGNNSPQGKNLLDEYMYSRISINSESTIFIKTSIIQSIHDNVDVSDIAKLNNNLNIQKNRLENKKKLWIT